MNWFKIAESQRRKRKRHVGESLEARLLLAADFRFDGLLGSAEKQTSEAPESLRLSEIGSPLSVSGRDGTPNGAYAFDGECDRISGG